MLEKFLKSKLGLLIILFLGTMFTRSATKFDEILLNENISSLSLLFIEGCVLISIIIIYLFFSRKKRNNLINDFKKINLYRILLFYLFSIIGIILAYYLNKALSHHKTFQYSFYEIIIGLIFYGFTLLTFNNSIPLKQLVLLIIIVIFMIKFF